MASATPPESPSEGAGEAYVEFPIIWIMPVWLRVTWVVLGSGTFAASTAGRTSSTSALSDLPHLRQMVALSNLLLALLWGSMIAMVVIANRSHDRRVAWSAPYRASPGQVPFFTPLSRTAAFGASARGPRSSATGFGWLLRTSGLILLVVFGVGTIIGGAAGVGHGHSAGAFWFLAGVASVGFVVWAMVQRFRQGKL